MKKLRITVEGKAYEVMVELLGEEGGVPAAAPRSGGARSAAVAAPSAASAPKKAPAAPATAGAVPSPLAGKVVSVDVQPGAAVKAGDQLVTLEAMKMNTYVTAPVDGTVGEIHVSEGQAVEEGQPLLTLA